MTFSESKCDASLRAALAGMVDSRKVPHALLFHEDDGGGAFPLALAFLQYLYCRDKRDGDSCGVCPACNKIGKLIHPDVHIIFPTAGGCLSAQYMDKFRALVAGTPDFTESRMGEALGIEGKNSVIAVSEAKNLLETLSLSALEGGYRSVIIYLPEKLNQEAANRLLKLIEEPPAQTQFILITHSPEKVLQTISSRCQRIRVIPSRRHVVEASEVEEGLFRDLMDALIARDLLEAVEVCEGIAALPSRENAKAFCKFATERMRQVFLVQQGMTSLSDGSLDVSRWASSCKKAFPRIAMENFSSAMRMLDRNVNTKIVFTSLAGRLYINF